MTDSQGYYLKVYADKLLIWERNFVTNHWFPNACFEARIVKQRNKKRVFFKIKKTHFVVMALSTKYKVFKCGRRIRRTTI